MALDNSSLPVLVRPSRSGHLYRRPVAPLYFPTEEEVPETNRHLEIRTALYLMLKDEVGAHATVGSEQFVYYDPTNPKRCLAPDVFVKLGKPHAVFDSWKVWERGAPDVGVEVVSAFDRPENDWDEKIERYRGAGVGEVVRFDADDADEPIRVWDHHDGDLVERRSDDPRLRECAALGLWWTVVDSTELGPTLRLARDREGRDLLPTPSEARIRAEQTARDEIKRRMKAEERAQAEAEGRAREAEGRAREAEGRAAAERERDAAERARDALAAENSQLRAQLAKRSGNEG